MILMRRRIRWIHALQKIRISLLLFLCPFTKYFCFFKASFKKTHAKEKKFMVFPPTSKKKRRNSKKKKAEE